MINYIFSAVQHPYASFKNRLEPSDSNLYAESETPDGVCTRQNNAQMQGKTGEVPVPASRHRYFTSLIRTSRSTGSPLHGSIVCRRLGREK